MIGIQTVPNGPEETRTGRTMSWQPYRFEDTPELSRREVRALREIARLLPGPDGGPQLRRALGLSLQRLQRPAEGTGVDTTSVGGPTVTVVGTSPGSASPSVLVDDLVYIRRHGSLAEDGWDPGPHPVRVHFGLGRQDLQAVLELPLSSVRSIVGAVVEVAPERLGASDLLTTVEQGVLAFFADRAATGLTERVPFLAPLMPVTIQGITCENREFDWGSAGPDGWYSVSAVVQVAGLSLPFRLAVPWKALEEARRSGQLGAGDEARMRRRRDHWLRTLGTAAVELRGLLGQAELTVADLNQLEPTDILLFEPTDFTWGEGGLGGRLALAQAEDGLVRIETEAFSDGTLLRLTVQTLMTGRSARREERPEVNEDRHTTGDAGAAGGPDPESTQPNDPTTTGVGNLPGRAAAEDTPIQLRVELGRLRLTLHELAQLAPGSILEMRQDPSAPVSLVVDDRIIGTGDLIRVEGELGVRIASLA